MEKFFQVFKGSENISLPLKTFAGASVAFDLVAGDFLYIGYEKFFRSFYLAFDVLNSNPATVTFEYNDGAVWKPFVVLDETYNFSKSGFVNFYPPLDWKKSEVAGSENFYVRISSSVDMSAGTKLQGIGILFSNDTDLEKIRSNIVSKYNVGKSWVVKHEEAKNQILQRIRNAGHRLINYRVTNSTLYFGNNQSLYFDDVTEFDLLKPFELREAAKYLTIASIYINELSDANDDKFERAGKHYMALYNEFMDVFMLKIDVNNNGIEDSEESDGSTKTELKWL